ncbi:alpha/beta hydrolase [Curtobacterium sp. APC 4022]|uniref:alpha/beta hydrolase n=1 Tax=Curtobacterium sp. APC 4022 TaxID=3035201 RepID=UPI0025B32671|nr:alpha/beta hydrolase [Curtobacterium sp. APC 4022]MDN3478695.1 alpha/beta hydrolase [Curtobacterium sp. APC 4022]
MGIEFDDVAVSRLVACLTDVALRLRASGAGRRASAERALQDFHGAYARLFAAARTIESEDRGRLTRALEDLTVQLHVVTRQADEERRRLEARIAWQERERRRDHALVAVGVPPGSVLDWASGAWDPEPSATPVRPTPVSAAFRARPRQRSTGSGGGGGTAGRSGADPRRLREFSGSAEVQDAATEQDLHRVRNAWAGFTARCAWVPVDEATLVAGFGDHLAEDVEDTAWVRRIANAFAAAGSGVSLADGVLDVAGTSTLPTGLQRVFDPAVTSAEVAAAWSELGLSEHDLRALPLTTTLQIANLDGVPAAARDIASRAVLRAALGNPERVYRMLGLRYTHGAATMDEFRQQVAALWKGVRRADRLAQELEAPSAAVAQLVGFGATDGALVAAVSLGDLDTASNVTVNVPGATTTLDSTDGQVRAAAGLLRGAVRLAPASSFAVVSWIGYRAPELVEVPAHRRAIDGGAALASFLDGVHDSRDGNAPGRLTVLGHSYGSAVAVEAAAQTRYRVDAVVTYGSVGFTDDTRPEHLNVRQVFATEGEQDHTARLGRIGRTDPRDLPGVHVFSSEAGPGTEAVTGHDMYPPTGVGYLSPDATAQRHIIEIIATGRPG